ncbi:MAG: dihydroorotate dehydrogenase [Clostridia bacterium]|nr:dihydroorotate dehydrogenase [Clostridia bacterium]
MADLSINLGDIKLKNPIIAASGCFSFGREFDQIYDISNLGGISCSGITLKEKIGNPPPRVYETSSGMINSVGLQNKGIEHFIENELPFLNSKNLAIIVNISGNSADEYAELAGILDRENIDIIELNVSCPNIRKGGRCFGSSKEDVKNILTKVRNKTNKNIMVKLTPNVTDVSEIAKCCEENGADIISLINTLTAMRIDIDTFRPKLKNNTGGLSGPAVFPVAVRMVNEVYNAVDIPVVGMGGISKSEDAIEMMIAGATAVQVGTANFIKPDICLDIIDGMENYLINKKIDKISDLVGKVKLW